MESHVLYIHVLCLALVAGLAHTEPTQGAFTIRAGQGATRQYDGTYSFTNGPTLEDEFYVTMDVDETQPWNTETFGPDEEPVSYNYYQITGGFVIPGTDGNYQTLATTVNGQAYDVFIYFLVGWLFFPMQPIWSGKHELPNMTISLPRQ